MPKDVSRDKRFLLLNKLISELENDYSLSREQLIASSEIKIPVSLFESNLSGLELISKYLIENLGFGIKSATKLTGRSKQNIWQAYRNSKKKKKDRFVLESSKYDIPVNVLLSKYSVLESIVVFLKEKHGLSYADIGRIINRDQRTVWTIYNRAMKK